MEKFEDYGIVIPFRRTHGNVKCVCPECQRQGKRRNLKDRSLSVNLDKGVWNCHYCGWSGVLKDGSHHYDDKPKREYKRPAPRPITELSRQLVSWFNGRGISELTLKRMQINEGKHSMPNSKPKQGDNRQWVEMNTVQFGYYLNGELINIKYRSGDKRFMFEAGAELIPYNIDAIADSDVCIITEGEMDCLSFIEAGYPYCISVPNGGGSKSAYLDDFMDGWFENKETIYIASDTDEKGIELRDELIRRFGAERCKVITYGSDCKDANEHLQKYGKESLQRCFKDAKDVKVDGVFTLSDYEDKLDAIYLTGLKKGFLIGHPNFDALCSFETKRLAIVTGIPGSGKSEFIDEMCVRINILYDYKVGFFSPENMPIELHAVKLIEKLCGKRLKQDDGTGNTIKPMEYKSAKEYYEENFFHILPEDGYTIDNILAKAKYLVKKYGIRVLVIDPFNRIESEQGNRETETQYISRVLDKLTNFAQQNGMLVFLMAHPTKIRKDINGGVPTLYDINGSANFYNKADFGIIVHRDRERKFTLVRVEKVKFRHLGEPGDAKFKFNVINGRYVPWEEGDVGTVFDTDNFIVKKMNEAITQPSMPMFAEPMQSSTINEDPFSGMPFLPTADEDVPF